MRKALMILLLAGLAAGSALAAAGDVSVTVLPKPRFGAPAGVPQPGVLRLVLVSSRYHAPEPEGTINVFLRRWPQVPGAQLLHTIYKPGGYLLFYGKDFSSARYVLGVNKTGAIQYAFDFANYVWPPRIVPGDREFVYEQVVWAQQVGGVLYVENAHSTYASSSYGQNAYITAIDVKTHRTLWRSAALVANAGTFAVYGNVIVAGYGFTAEPDYLYLLDRHTGKALDRLLLPTAAETIVRHGSTFSVRTYDHDVVAKLVRG